MKKYLILILIFWLLVLFQESFLSHFRILAGGLNLILISIFLLNFLESEENKFGIFAGFLGGIFLDVSSTLPFGTFILTLIGLSFFIKKAGTLVQKSNLFSFSIIFCFSFFFYKFTAPFLAEFINLIYSGSFNLVFGFNLMSFLSSLFLHLGFVILLFFLDKKYGFFPKR